MLTKSTKVEEVANRDQQAPENPYPSAERVQAPLMLLAVVTVRCGLPRLVGMVPLISLTLVSRVLLGHLTVMGRFMVLMMSAAHLHPPGDDQSEDAEHQQNEDHLGAMLSPHEGDGRDREPNSHQRQPKLDAMIQQEAQT